MASRWGKSHQARRLAEANRRAKIEPPINFHGLRHTWASLRIMRGLPLMVAAQVLGHSDTRMVEKHYGHLAKNYVADAIELTTIKLPDEPGQSDNRVETGRLGFDLGPQRQFSRSV